MPRLKLGPYFGLWALLVAAQLWVLATWTGEAPGAALATAAALQLLKVPVVVGRLKDLGRAPDDALLALIPLANIGLWNQLNRRSPSDEQRERSRARWSGELLALQAFARGAAGVGRNALVVLPLVLLFGLLFSAGEYWLVDALLTDAFALPSESLDLLVQVLALASGLLLLYTFGQLLKGKKASRASWFPVFFLPPLALSLATLVVLRDGGGVPQGLGEGARGMGPVMAAASVWGLFWMTILGSALAVLWVSVAEAQREGRSLSPAVLGRMVRRTPDVSAAHGGAALAIWLGLQVIIPGIYYGLQFAFVDAVAVLDREGRPFQQTNRLTKGIRRRVFKVYAAGFLLAVILSILAAVIVETGRGSELGAAAAVQGVVFLLIVMPAHLSGLSFPAFAAVSCAMILSWGIARVGLVHMYWEQAARAEAASTADRDRADGAA